VTYYDCSRRDDDKLQNVGEHVRRVRKAAGNGLVLELDKNCKDVIQKMKAEIGNALGQQARIRSVTQEISLEIRDIDCLATRAHISAALAPFADSLMDDGIIKSLRSGYEEMQIAIVSLPVTVANRVLKEGKVKIGWTRCRVRERVQRKRCYRCLEFGLVASSCKSAIDRTGCCLKCGDNGHKAADCTEDAKCLIYSTAGKAGADEQHHAGSKRCPTATKNGANMSKKLIQLNMNHCATAHDLIQQTVRELSVDVALLSEPYRSMENADFVSDSTGKAAIWVCGPWSCKLVCIHSARGFVRARLGELWLYSCYLAPSLPLPEFEAVLEEISEDARGKPQVVIAGAFNAWAEEWGSNSTNARGRAVLEVFASLDVALLNSDGKHTFS